MKQQRMIAAHRLIAKMPTLAAMAYKYSVGQPFIYPRNDLKYSENFLHMTFAVPAEDYRIKSGAGQGHGPDLHPARGPRAECLDLDSPARGLVRRQSVRLHRRRASPRCGARPMAARNEAVLKMLEEIGSKDQVAEYVKRREGQGRSLPPDGLRPPRLQELRPPRQGDAPDLPRGPGRARRQGRAAARPGDGAGADRP